MQYGTARIDLNGSAEVILRQFESLLTEEDGAQPVPGIVVAIIAENRRAKRCDRFLQIFIVHL